MELDIQGDTGAVAGKVEVSDQVFGCDFNESLIHQVVTAYMAAGRAGTRAQKSRSAVRGGGKKPWSQKGTGRARAGTSRSPLWRSGGVTFAAQPQNYQQKVNRKMYRSAVRSILSELARQQRLIVVDEFAVSAPKTRELVGKLSAMGIDEALIVVDAYNEHLELACRNLHNVGVLCAHEVDPVVLVGFDKVLITKAAVAQLEERLS